MISIIVSSINPEQNRIFCQNMAETIGVKYELLIHDNRETGWGLCKLYNHYAARSRYDLLCFCHEDILFHTAEWGKEILQFFDHHPRAGVVGFAGSTIKTEHLSGWGTLQQATRIHIRQQFPNGTIRTLHTPKIREDFTPVALVDGLALITRKKIWQEYPFDEETFQKFHLYDLDFSMQIAQHYTNYVCHTLDLTHFSKGSYTQEWFLESGKFISKWRQKLPFYVLPYPESFVKKCTDLDAYKTLKMQLIYTPKNLPWGLHVSRFGKVKTFPYKFKLIRYIWRDFTRQMFIKLFLNLKIFPIKKTVPW